VLRCDSELGKLDSTLVWCVLEKSIQKPLSYVTVICMLSELYDLDFRIGRSADAEFSERIGRLRPRVHVWQIFALTATPFFLSRLWPK
jgi:hypothetical protein